MPTITVTQERYGNGVSLLYNGRHVITFYAWTEEASIVEAEGEREITIPRAEVIAALERLVQLVKEQSEGTFVRAGR